MLSQLTIRQEAPPEDRSTPANPAGPVKMPVSGEGWIGRSGSPASWRRCPLKGWQKGENAMSDSRLKVRFCGLTAINPFFLSSSCVSHSYEMCARAFSMGWGGAVWKTVGVYRPAELSPRFSACGGNGRPFTGFRNLEQIRAICRVLKKTATLPLFVKLSPEGDAALTAETALRAGADGLTALNTFPSLTLEERSGRVSPEISGQTAVGGFSGPAVRPMTLRRLAELSQRWPGIPIHATGGCKSWTDARDYLAMGRPLFRSPRPSWNTAIGL